MRIALYILQFCNYHHSFALQKCQCFVVYEAQAVHAGLLFNRVGNRQRYDDVPRLSPLSSKSRGFEVPGLNQHPHCAYDSAVIAPFFFLIFKRRRILYGRTNPSANRAQTAAATKSAVPSLATVLNPATGRLAAATKLLQRQRQR